jgi:hypothetical protein
MLRERNALSPEQRTSHVPTLHRPSLLIIGLVALAIGYLLRRWADRHDLQGKATDAVWKSVRTRDTGAITGELKRHADEIAGAGGFAAAGVFLVASGIALS